jgi:undecaprenyl-diphosphatase
MLKNSILYVSAKVKAFFKLPFMQRRAARYPGLFAFLRRRFATENFFGFPFTFLLGLLVVNLFMLSEIAENIVNSSQMKVVDGQIALWLYQNRWAPVSIFLYCFTQLGSVSGVTIITLALVVFYSWRRKKAYLVALLLSVIGNGISVYATKIYFHRERPVNVSYYLVKSFSFPSGHSAAAISLGGLACYFFMLDAKTNQVRRYWFYSGVIYILLIGFSRIYLGVHFLSDVIAGYLLGALWAIVAVIVMEYQILNARKVRQKLY